MVKKYYDFNFELSIDGQPYPPEKAAPLFQRDPFPGGHKYSCTIFGKRIAKRFDYLSVGKSEDITDEFASRFFLSLGLSWVQNAEKEDAGPEYFLNSLEEIDFDGTQIKFSGVCSAVLKNEATPF